jgi:hypothetical protein
MWAVAVAVGREAGELQAREQLVVEVDHPALDHLASRVPRSTSGTWAAGFAVQAKWHAATCSRRPGPAVSAGSTVSQSGVCASGQRG